MPVVQPKFENDNPPVPPGTYRCRILSSEIKTSKKTNNAYVSWKMEIESPDPNVNRRWVYHNTPVEGPGSGMFKHFVHAAGLHQYRGGPFDTDQLTGCAIQVITEKNFKEDGTESTFPRVVGVMPDKSEAVAAKANQPTDDSVDFDNLPF